MCLMRVMLKPNSSKDSPKTLGLKMNDGCRRLVVLKEKEKKEGTMDVFLHGPGHGSEKLDTP